MKNRDLKAFGVSKKLDKFLKDISTTEIVFGLVFLLISVFCFCFFVSCLGYNTWGKPFLEFFGYTVDDQATSDMRLVLALIVCAISSLVVGVFALFFGIKSKQSNKNPVSLIQSKTQLKLSIFFYILFACFNVFGFILSFVLWPLVCFSAVMFCFCVVLAVFTILQLKNFPNTAEVLDVHNLPKTKQQSILAQSSRKSFDEEKLKI